MIVSMERNMVVRSWRSSKYGCVLVLFILLGSAGFIGTSNVYAAGVHFGFGVDVPFPGRAVAPPVVMYPPPVVVEERIAPPQPWVVEQAPPPVVIKQTPPAVVYEGPVVVERRSTVYYYPRSQEYRSEPRETEREYYRERRRSWEDDNSY